VSRAGEAERRRLHATFEALCRIESPTGRERRCADWVTGELEGLGIEVHRDGAGAAAGSDSGNLYAFVAGSGPRNVMMCAHLDTVPLTAPVEPVFRDDGWQNANAGILGADNKAAVAALVELARLITRAPERPEVGLELVFTVGEETGLRGAKAFDVSRLRSEFGYVFDHASPLGEIVTASPSYQRVTAVITGRAAHAGIRPQDGRSAIAAAAHAIAAMQLGRLDDETTANIGTIEGGTATNVVPERCRLRGEVRGLREDRLDEAVTQMIDALQGAVDAAECDLDVELERTFEGYRTNPSAPAVQLASSALRRIGYEPRTISSGGGSDANALRSAGFECVNLANGTERNHEPDERVSGQSLEDGLELALALLDAAADGSAPAETDGVAAAAPRGSERA
jgi:tripeptide aminopeptidase